MQSTDNTSATIDGRKHEGPLLLTAEKVAELLDISVRTLWRLRSAGKLPTPVRLGGSVRWRAHEIVTWIEKGCPEQARRSTTSKVS